MGTESIVGRGGPKIVTERGGNMASGRGTTSWDREGELSKKEQKI